MCLHPPGSSHWFIEPLALAYSPAANVTEPLVTNSTGPAVMVNRK